MSVFFTCLLVGISLSMDAFSLSLIYGTYGINKRDILLLSFIVGVFHFFMPLFGLGFGELLNSYLFFDVGVVVPVIFSIIGISMIISSVKDEDINVVISVIGFIFFGLSVSMDSFTTGIGLSMINSNYFMCSVIFMMVSSIFTYIGLNIGNKINESSGKYSTIVGGIIMLLMALYYFFKI